jgi:hypothetical protein
MWTKQSIFFAVLILGKESLIFYTYKIMLVINISETFYYYSMAQFGEKGARKA